MIPRRFVSVVLEFSTHTCRGVINGGTWSNILGAITDWVLSTEISFWLWAGIALATLRGFSEKGKN